MALYDTKYGRYVYPWGERINYSEIHRICDKIIDEANKLDKCANDKWNTLDNLENAAKDVNSDKVLMVNGRHYNQYISGIQGELTEKYKALKSLAQTIKTEATNRYNTECNQYNTYIWRIEEEKASSSTSS